MQITYCNNDKSYKLAQQELSTVVTALVKVVVLVVVALKKKVSRMVSLIAFVELLSGLLICLSVYIFTFSR